MTADRPFLTRETLADAIDKTRATRAADDALRDRIRTAVTEAAAAGEGCLLVGQEITPCPVVPAGRVLVIDEEFARSVGWRPATEHEEETR